MATSINASTSAPAPPLLNSLLPVQSAGTFLKSDGANTSFAAVATTDLSDRATGTWTANLTTTTSGTITINNSYKTGHYVKEGRTVVITAYLAVSSVSAPVGQVQINNLPYTASAGTEYRVSVDVIMNNALLPLTGTCVGIVQEGTAYITLYDSNNGSLGAIASKFQATTDLVVNVTYITD